MDSASSGVSRLGYSVVILKPSSRIELYIDKKNQEENKKIFDYLHKNREEIEKNFSHKLDWQRMDTKRASRIAYNLRKSGLNHEAKWDQIQDNLINLMKNFQEIIDPYIKSL